MPRTETVDLTFDWRALPKGIKFLSSFGNGQRLQRLRAPWFRVQEAVFAGGDFRITKSHENGTTLVLAARGTWKFSDAEAFGQIRRVIDEENKFWHVQTLPSSSNCRNQHRHPVLAWEVMNLEYAGTGTIA
jgi:hypothetical protein